MKRRSGFSLSELSVTLVAGSTLMLLAVSMVHESFQWTRTSHERVQSDRSFDRLQRQLRLDVHWSGATMVNDQTLQLSLHDERSVVYTIEPSQVTRTEDSARHESYQLGDDLQLTLSELSDPSRVVLAAKRRTPLKDADVPSWRHVEAVVGYLLQGDETKETP